MTESRQTIEVTVEDYERSQEIMRELLALDDATGKQAMHTDGAIRKALEGESDDVQLIVKSEILSYALRGIKNEYQKLHESVEDFHMCFR